jgi:hypothetical protein
MSNTTTTASVSSERGLTTASCPSRPFSETCVSSSSPVLLENTGDLRTWLQAAFPASPSAPQESEPEPTTRAICGPPPSSASAWYDPDTACWRTFQDSFLAGTLAPFSETWPRAGMVCAGEFYRQPNWERRISETDCGLWPTPKTTEYKDPRGKTGNRSDEAKTKAGWTLSEKVRMFPTPTDPSKGGGSSRSHDRRDEIPSLQGMARAGKWPTPKARDYRTGMEARVEPRAEAGLPVDLNDQVGGQLNPQWVSWLMGWPLGWESLQPMRQETWRAWLAAFLTE